ncbi:hypothetical protein BCEN4_1640003 [Burkholderia cenocepacia]|nr:hypothetical protein BCEN4_1640003 [Burkholderia cenocepacia]
MREASLDSLGAALPERNRSGRSGKVAAMLMIVIYVSHFFGWLGDP